MKAALILNRDAGTLRGADADAVAADIVAVFAARGHTVTPNVVAGADAVSAIRDACAKGEGAVVIVGGGDGTVSAAATAAAEHGATLGVLPLGTMNFFARSLGIPLGDIIAAAEALADGEVVPVDLARVNGETFVHALALGIHPSLVAEREKAAYRSRYGKMLASVRAWFRILRHIRRFAVALDVDGARILRRTAGLVVSNNPLGEGHLPYADDLRDGLLGIYVTSARGPMGLMRVTASAALGTVAKDPLVEVLEAPGVDIAFSRSTIPATLDGELVRLRSPLKVESLKGALRVLRPLPKPDEDGGKP